MAAISETIAATLNWISRLLAKKSATNLEWPSSGLRYDAQTCIFERRRRITVGELTLASYTKCMSGDMLPAARTITRSRVRQVTLARAAPGECCVKLLTLRPERWRYCK